IVEIVEKSRGLELFYAVDEQQKERLWEARKKIAYAVKDYARKVYKADIVVPRGQIPNFIKNIRSLENEGLTIATFGHIGDGNIHLNIL
ncbi:MAG: FAD-linked oxidase, partial [Proteobacteria bacterium]|nr:FAD-linked oxidase [Pseudomonadota bacterium]